MTAILILIATLPSLVFYYAFRKLQKQTKEARRLDGLVLHNKLEEEKKRLETELKERYGTDGHVRTYPNNIISRLILNKNLELQFSKNNNFKFEASRDRYGRDILKIFHGEEEIILYAGAVSGGFLCCLESEIREHNKQVDYNNSQKKDAPTEITDASQIPEAVN
ncbi:hypothetical protein [Bartonella sp. DGB1]|uniref:hypothetical protein n=1 Tax=Bartonella sp. DGB1 TaxID=3239807 RepID=UPI0035261ECB